MQKSSGQFFENLTYSLALLCRGLLTGKFSFVSMKIVITLCCTTEDRYLQSDHLPWNINTYEKHWLALICFWKSWPLLAELLVLWRKIAAWQFKNYSLTVLAISSNNKIQETETKKSIVAMFKRALDEITHIIKS